MAGRHPQGRAARALRAISPLALIAGMPLLQVAQDYSAMVEGVATLLAPAAPGEPASGGFPEPSGANQSPVLDPDAIVHHDRADHRDRARRAQDPRKGRVVDHRLAVNGPAAWTFTTHRITRQIGCRQVKLEI